MCDENESVLVGDSVESLEIAPELTGVPKGLSKNQQKKLIRAQKRSETKAQWRKLQKDKRKLKELQKKKEYAESGLEYLKKKRVRTDLTKIKESRIVFDLSFNDIMVERELRKLCSQIMRCYASNRRSDVPFNVDMSSFHGEVAEKFKSMVPEHDKWDMHFYPDHFSRALKEEADKIVYLSPDAEDVLESIEPDHVYIIGGIVDKNRYKGKSLQTAQDLKIKTARLPVQEYMDLKTSTVLTVFHVFEILLKFKESKDWKVSLEEFVPKRNTKGSLDEESDSEPSE